MNEVVWLDSYRFSVHSQMADWSHNGGIYIFCGVNPQNQWVPLYIGQADSFRNRIPQHEQWNPAVRRGATHVHAMALPELQRDWVEQRLIQAYQPHLNVHHKAF
ncbi:MAG: GIY-YIG nuclease family protein [Limisphaerales bacterium]